MKRWATIPFFLVFGMLLWPSAALGQGATTASIRGKVVDADGQPLPGANVLAVHQPTGTRYGTSANRNGQYTLANLRAGGPYTITVTFVGYQSQRETGVELSLGQSLQLDFDLKEKTAELEEVEVIGERSGVTANREGVSTSISTAEIESQPTMGRSIADLARLSPQSYVANGNDDGAAISIAGQWNRFNSIYIDGAVTNDVFGLSAQGTPGGQSGASPISLSAVEAMSVDVAPFDVTKGGFVGGAINFVTKNGTNNYEGSFEYFRRGSGLTQSKLSVDGEQLVDGLPDASDDRYVFNLGGPIVKDKLFFFVNVDIRRKSDGVPLQPNYQGSTPLRGDNGNNQLDGIFEIRPFMQRNTGYNPGTPGDKATVLDSEKYLARLDYNMTPNHKLTARYYYNDNYNVDRFQSTQTGINFSNNSEVFPSKQHNAMLQWRGSFGSSVATKTTATFQTVTDDRGVSGEPFPNISIDNNGAGISLGSEPFSYPNFLEQNVGTLTNETDIFLGDHTVTVGTHNEFYGIDNRFAIFGPGSYSFNNLSDFAETVCHYAQQNQGNFGIDGPGPICQANYPNAEPQTNLYLRQYSLLDDDPSTPEFESKTTDDTNLRSEFSALRLSAFAQDEWRATDRLSLRLGLRAEFPKILDDPQAHPTANSETIPMIKDAGYDLNGAQAGKMPDWRIFLSPRFGFSYDVTEDRSTNVRGGMGVFTSRLPYVWPGGAYLNDGVSAAFDVGLGFAGPLPLRRPQNGLTKFEDNTGIFGGGAFGSEGVDSVDELTPTGNLIIFRNDFSPPRVLRTSLAIDQELPFGLVGTLEGQYSSKLKDVIVQNVNLKQSNEQLDGPDNRPIWTQPRDFTDESIGIDSRYGDIYLLDNTNRGYSYTVTASLQKEPTRVWDGGVMRGNVSYSYGDSRSLNQFGDTVGSNWGDNPHVNGTNNLTLGRSPYSLGHKVQLSLAYRQEITESVSTNLSLFYSGTSGRPFSYTIGGGANENMIGEGGGTPLFYIPEDVSNLQFNQITDGNGNVLRSVQEQRQDLRNFINNVDYLSENRGDYATRNADRTPFESVVDLKFSVEIAGELVGRSQSLSINANVFNFSSLLGDIFGTDWGRRYVQVGSFSPVNFEEFVDAENGDFTPVYESSLGTSDPIQNKEELFNVESGTQTYSSLYQLQLGVEYTF